MLVTGKGICGYSCQLSRVQTKESCSGSVWRGCGLVVSCWSCTKVVVRV